MKKDFFSIEEKKIADNFYQDGYVIVPVSDLNLLGEIKQQIFAWGQESLVLDKKITQDDFFNHSEKYILIEKLNDVRVKLIQQLSTWTELRPTLYHLGQKYIDWIVGNEIAMQRAVNLSIQLPNDKSSLLPLHTDVWSGNSPYEIVFWIPLVDCYKTKSMFILPYKKSQEVINQFPQYAHLNVEELYQKLKNDVIELEVPYGHGVIFSHSLLHGNRINLETDTRWTFNVRFKSLLSPYGTKEVGETFLPTKVRPLTKIGFNYQKPTIQ